MICKTIKYSPHSRGLGPSAMVFQGFYVTKPSLQFPKNKELLAEVTVVVIFFV